MTLQFDRIDLGGEPAGRVQPPTAAQLAMMHRNFMRQAAQAERDGEAVDARRWRRLAETLKP